MPGYWTFSCTCTITSHYVTGCFLALAPSRHATLLDVLLHLHHHVTLRYWTFSCTCTITSHYVTGRFLALAPSPLLHYWTFSCTCTITSTTLLDFFLHFHITSCYASGRFLALAPPRHVVGITISNEIPSRSVQRVQRPHS